METPTFDQLPSWVASMRREIQELKELVVDKIKDPLPQADNLILLPRAAQILGIAETTVYSKVCRKEIPYIKRGKRLFFSEKELYDYLMQGKVKTADEIDREAETYLSSKK